MLTDIKLINIISIFASTWRNIIINFVLGGDLLAEKSIRKQMEWHLKTRNEKILLKKLSKAKTFFS